MEKEMSSGSKPIHGIFEKNVFIRKIINGKVNPRLVSRWESYTGEYNPRDVLNNTKSGVLYPTI
jgi:hypothetical protein